MRTARSTSWCDPGHRRRRRGTGCRPRPAGSSSCSGPICPARPSWTAATNCRRSSRCREVNRLILKHGYLVTAVVLLVFAWVVVRRLAGGPNEIVPLAVAAVVVWLAGVFLFVYFWPRITVGGFKRAILKRGFGGGPIPVNTLYAVPDRPSRFAS